MQRDTAPDTLADAMDGLNFIEVYPAITFTEIGNRMDDEFSDTDVTESAISATASPRIIAWPKRAWARANDRTPNRGASPSQEMFPAGEKRTA